jgi:hypothetical protein
MLAEKGSLSRNCCLAHKATSKTISSFVDISPNTDSVQTKAMSHLSNPLATAEQLYKKASVNDLPAELQDSILFFTARLTQAAGILLRLPQDVTAQANVLLFRYWLVDGLMQHEFSVCTQLLIVCSLTVVAMAVTKLTYS